MKSKHVLVSLHDSGKHAHTKIICAGMMMSVRGCLYSETLIAGGRDMRQGGMLIRAQLGAHVKLMWCLLYSYMLHADSEEWGGHIVAVNLRF